MMLCQIRRYAVLLLLDCGKQLNTFDRSVSNAAYSPPWSGDFLNFSIITTRQLCGLKAFRKLSGLVFRENVSTKMGNLVIKYIFKDFRKIW